MGNQESRFEATSATEVEEPPKSGVSYVRLLVFALFSTGVVAVNYAEGSASFYGVVVALMVVGYGISFIVDRSLGRGFNTLLCVREGNVAAAIWWVGTCLIAAAAIIGAAISLYGSGSGGEDDPTAHNDSEEVRWVPGDRAQSRDMGRPMESSGRSAIR